MASNGNEHDSPEIDNLSFEEALALLDGLDDAKRSCRTDRASCRPSRRVWRRQPLSRK